MTTNIAHTLAATAPVDLEVTPTPCGERPCNGNRSIVFHDDHNTKTKLVNARSKREELAAIMGLASKKPALMSALIDCACSADTTTEVARRHSIHKSVLAYWSRKLGLPKRHRGRHAFLHPTPQHRRILELVREHGVVEAARRVGVSKQRVSHIAQRWKQYLPVRALRVQAT